MGKQMSQAVQDVTALLQMLVDGFKSGAVQQKEGQTPEQAVKCFIDDCVNGVAAARHVNRSTVSANVTRGMGYRSIADFRRDLTDFLLQSSDKLVQNAVKHKNNNTTASGGAVQKLLEEIRSTL